jgi:chromosome segregation ATPase
MGLDQQRPSDPLTAADAARLLDEMKKSIREELQPNAGIMASLQRTQLHILEILKALSADLAETRVRRLEEELFEVEREREILQERIRIVDEKKKMKESDAVGAADTNEKMKKAAESTYAERERTEQEQRAAVWRKRWDAVVTAVLVTTSVGFVGALLTAIGWFILFYINNR